MGPRCYMGEVTPSEMEVGAPGNLHVHCVNDFSIKINIFPIDILLIPTLSVFATQCNS